MGNVGNLKKKIKGNVGLWSVDCKPRAWFIGICYSSLDIDFLAYHLFLNVQIKRKTVFSESMQPYSDNLASS